MNNDKYQLYADRIQNTLMRPEILMVMQKESQKKHMQSQKFSAASKAPSDSKGEMTNVDSSFEEEEEVQKVVVLSPEDLKKKEHADQDKRKKERQLKLMQNLEEVKQTEANGGVTNVEKLIEE